MTQSPDTPATPTPETTKPTSRIRWKSGPYNSANGYAGDVEVFTAGYGSVRSDTMYYLQSRLPGHGSDRGALGQKYTSMEDAKAAAEGVWERWLNRVGATPNDIPTDTTPVEES